MKWIDLFNIGNVMLMRGLDIQQAAQGTCLEFDSREQMLEAEEAEFLHMVAKR
jgi:hypothetical protein